MLDDRNPLSVGISSEQPSNVVSLEKLPLSTPMDHGSTLHFPPFNEIDSLWQRNLNVQQVSETSVIGESPLGSLRRKTRQELLKLATRYSQQYGDFPTPTSSETIVMAGHQPTLYHPGVWYKNFVLSNLGRRFNGTCLNLIVDNDVCQRSDVAVPHIANGRVSTQLVHFDAAGYQVPFEERPIENLDMFRSFESRVTDAIKPFVDNPIARRLWPHVLTATRELGSRPTARLGHAIAAGRHRLESEIGLQTLEIPLGLIADSDPFIEFSLHIITNLDSFRKIYNESVGEYRSVFRVRSRSHPVPDLAKIEQWTESPFWLWHVDNPFRKRLFVKLTEHSTCYLSDLNGWEVEISNRTAQEQVNDLRAQGIKIRPRALLTTMFCRLLVSDLFVHGIGGAKYDQLTDLIASRFFDCRLPEFCAVSATMRLPKNAHRLSARDITDAKRMLREFDFHPERFIDSASHANALPLIERKLALIRQPPASERMKQRHVEFAECNRLLRGFVATRRNKLEAQIQQWTEELRIHNVLGSRELSFCLFSNGLIDELLDLSRPANPANHASAWK